MKHVYFVAETKGNDIEVSQLRRAEDAKIKCARRHFAAISEGDVAYSVVKTYQDLYDAVMKQEPHLMPWLRLMRPVTAGL